MIGCLGDDAFGARLREQLAAAGVGLAHLRTVAPGSGMSVAIVQDCGDYAAVVVSGANRALDEGQVGAAAETLQKSRVLLLQNEIGEDANAAAAGLARAAGSTVILNAAPARPPAAGLGGLVDILVVNAVEAEMLGGGSVSDLGSAAAAARRLRKLSATVIVTAGAQGLAAMSDTESLEIAAHPVTHPETHGAGDAFVGALAAQLAESRPLPDALHYANAAAALHVGMPEDRRAAIRPQDVERLLSRPDEMPQPD
jgi:ribokinase